MFAATLQRLRQGNMSRGDARRVRKRMSTLVNAFPCWKEVTA